MGGAGMGGTGMGGTGDGGSPVDAGGDVPSYVDGQMGDTSGPPGGPAITDVHISQIGQNIHIEVDGAGFGTAPLGLPSVGNIGLFAITDISAGGWCAGRTNCPVALQYTSWADTRIVIDGFGPTYGGTNRMLPGDRVSIFVQGTGSTASTTWTGTIQNEAPPPCDPGGPTPRVTSVNFSGIGQNMHIEVLGCGFGNAPVGLPAVGNLGVFGIYDNTQGNWCAGRTNCPVALQYTTWSDGRIAIDGFGPTYGGTNKVAANDAVSIYIQNSGGPEFMVWSGTLQEGTPPPCGAGGPTPHVTSVNFSGIGPNMHIDVVGCGFGNAPVGLPVVGNIGVFGIYDTSQGNWCAGRTNCPVALQYTTWTDTRIAIDGFGPTYGGTNKVAANDAVSIYIQNSGGPEFTVWSGTLQEGTPPPCGAGGPTPHVTSVSFSGIGPNMHIEVVGCGFGTAPGGLPAVANLGVFGIYDTSRGSWCAGRINCPVALHYTSWNDGTIIIDGFGSTYGGTNIVTAGDSVSIFVENSAGPEFMVWSGTLQ